MEAVDATKTSMDRFNNVLWCEGDEVVAFMKTTLGLRYQINEEYIGSTTGSFSKAPDQSGNDDLETGQELAHNVVLYPYSEQAGCMKNDDADSAESYNLSIYLPEVQRYAENSFSNGSFPMVAVSTSNQLAFKNICGGLKLHLKGSDRIKSIKLEGMESELISGQASVTGYTDGSAPTISMETSAYSSVTLDCGDGVQLNPESAVTFIIAVPPTEFKSGMKITVTDTDGLSKILTNTSANTIKRSSLLTFPVITYTQSEVVEFDESHCIYYKGNTKQGYYRDDYYLYKSHINCDAGGKVMEMKFQLKSTGTYYLAAGVNMRNSYDKLMANNNSLYIYDRINKDDGNSYSWNWSDIGVSPTDLITLTFNGKKETITVNGKVLECPGIKDMYWDYLFSAYAREYDDGEWEEYYSVPEGSALYYVKMYNAHVNVLTVNPDGCPGLSTIGYWRYVNNREGGADVVISAADWTYTRPGTGADQVVFQLTDGQNARNLLADGSRCTIQLTANGANYLLHLDITEVYAQEFTQEAYDAGEFATGYSGADRQATSYYFVGTVLSIEKSYAIQF